MNSVAVCTGALTANADGTIACTGAWIAQAAPVPFDPTTIAPAVATAFFVGGFSLVVVPWAAAFGGRMLLKAINSI